MTDGYYRDEHDCHKFYHCANGLPYHITCTGGLVFNPETEICDWPYMVPVCANSMRKIFVPPIEKYEIKHQLLDMARSGLVDTRMSRAERSSRLQQNGLPTLTTTMATYRRPTPDLTPHLPFTTPDYLSQFGHRPFTAANPMTTEATTTTTTKNMMTQSETEKPNFVSGSHLKIGKPDYTSSSVHTFEPDMPGKKYFYKILI